MSNELLRANAYLEDRHRSLTSPEYCMAEHGLRCDIPINCSVVAAHLYTDEKKTLLLLVTSEEEMLIYRKYFNLEDGNFVFRRVCTPLNVVKSFRWR